MSVNSVAAKSSPVRRPVLGMIAIVVLVIAALTALDLFLSKTQQTELESAAQQFYRDGTQALKDGKANQAVELLRRAHALARRNGAYQLALIEALAAAGKIDETEPLMTDILDREPNDGRANLIAARLSLQRGRITDAESYYHRAIYGEWPASPGDAQGRHGANRQRIAVRMELIQVLAARGKKQELLAELLPLEEEAGNDAEIEKKLGTLFLRAGSPSRAADVYRALIQQEPRNPAAYAGLGEAELEEGDYRAAKAAFITAFAHDREDASVRERMELSNTMTALDPTPRRLSSAEKYRRSMHILDLSRTSLDECLTSHPGAGSSDSEELLGAAQQSLSSKPPAHVTNELSEQTLGLAERIWQARMKACGESTATDEEPLRLIMARLAQ